MPTVPGRGSPPDTPSNIEAHITPDQGPSGRRILPDGPGGWAKLVAAVAGLVLAITELAKVVVGG